MQVRIHLLDLQYIEQHSLAKFVEQLLADLHLAMAGTACEQGPQVDRFSGSAYTRAEANRLYVSICTQAAVRSIGSRRCRLFTPAPSDPYASERATMRTSPCLLFLG